MTFHVGLHYLGLNARKPVFGVSNNKGADQPYAQSDQRLRLMESITSHI